MTIISNASDEALEAILRKAENTHSAGSQFEQAQIELDIRRKKRLFELQQELLRINFSHPLGVSTSRKRWYIRLYNPTYVVSRHDNPSFPIFWQLFNKRKT